LRRGEQVHALSRTPDGSAAQDLADLGATLVEGDLDDPRSIKSAMNEADSVFCVLAVASPEDEIRRGVAAAEAASAAGIRHFVLLSVFAAETGSGVPLFESKWEIEQRLNELGVPTTALRPTAFMENFNTYARPQVVDGELVVRAAMSPETPHQMIACADIGEFAAIVLQDPDEYIGAAVPLAGDQLTGAGIAAAFDAAVEIPARFERQPIEQLRAFAPAIATMWEWVEAGNNQGIDIDSLRERNSQLRTLADWLAETDWQA
jgi:uncharacterized protein YbjT (DUF2867 family)